MIQTMIRKAAVLVLPLACAAAPAVHADILRDWNLVVTGDAYVKHETEGPVRVGGDLYVAGGTYEVKPRTGTMVGTGGVGLIVGGDVIDAQFKGVKLHSGADALIGGTNTPLDRFEGFGTADVTMDSSAARAVGASDAALLQSYSDGFLGLAQTNSFAVNVDGNKGLFVVAGNSVGNAVFNVTATEVFGNSNLGSLVLDLNGRVFVPGESIVINVSGSAVSFLGGRNFDGDFNTPAGFGIGNTQGVGNPNVIWNFYEATTIDMLGGNFKGAMLANQATLLNTNTIDGGVFVKQLGTSTNPFNGQNAEIHPPLYWGYVPNATAVPEPSAFAMAGVALAAGAALAAKRRRSA